MKTLLVPLDGSDYAEQALPFVKQISASGDRVVLLSVQKPETPAKRGSRPGRRVRGAMSGPSGGVMGVVTPEVPVFAETTDQSIDRQLHEAQDYLEGLASPLRSAHFQVQTETRLDEHPAEAIITLARELKPDVIVMLRRTHFGLGERLFGSVATRVIESEVAPVALVPVHK